MKKTILVLGDGVAGLSAACLLAKQLPKDLVSVQVVAGLHSARQVPEFTRSTIHRFHDIIGLQEKNVILGTNASFGLGVWYKSRESDYVLAEGNYGSPMEGVDFLAAYFKCLENGGAYRLDDFSLNAVAARCDRFGHPVTDVRSVYSAIQYGLNIEPNSYASLLRDYAIFLGVKFLDGVVQSVQARDDGGIEKIELEGGESVSADLYIDCSGCANLADQAVVGAASDPLKTIFDTMAYGYRPAPASAKRVTQVEVEQNGIVKIIPLKDAECICYFYSQQQMGAVSAQDRLMAMGVNNVDYCSLKSQTNLQPWVANFIDMGAGCPSVFDLFYSSLNSVRNASVRLLDLLSSFDHLEETAIEYNRLSRIESEQIGEFVELNLFLAKNTNQALSEYFEGHPLSDRAKHRYDLFAAHGRSPFSSTKIFSEFEWALVWAANNIFPAASNPDVIDVAEERISKHLKNLQEFIVNAVEKMPKHVDYMVRVTNSK